MISRTKVISQAIESCLEELYKYAQPSVDWEDFKKQNAEWKEGEPKPYEFYYLHEDITKEICEYYIDAYRIGSELESTVQILVNYLRYPIVDKYIEEYTDDDGNYHPGKRGYENPDNLVTELTNIIQDSKLAEKCEVLVYKFLYMATDFYKWDNDLQKFNFNVYLGASPSSNKEEVINNWKKYRNKDIEIEDYNLNEWYEDIENV